MLASQIPTKFPIPFGNNAAAGTIRPIPQASQTSTSLGQASLYDGFPVATGQPLASGGVPPAMQDFNGLFNQITAWSRWQNAGGTVSFDQAFCTAIGGYPQGAVLASTTAGSLWVSVVDNNTTNPDLSSASGWIAIVTGNILATQTIIGATVKEYQVAGTYQWVAPPTVRNVQVEAWSGGGGGGGASATGSAAAGGGGGVYGKGTYAVTPGATYVIIVGAGGTGGAANSSTPGMGGTGGTTSFSTFLTITGGKGGQAAAGGTATMLSDTGTISGSQTAVGGYFGGLPINAGGSLIGGSGGSAFGSSAPPPNVGPANGNPGVFPGGGGTGASGLASGGPGGSGRLILTF